MDIKITENQFDAYKNKLSIDDFKTLDVNGDNVLSKEDIETSNNDEVKSALQNLLSQVDEETDVENFDLNDLDSSTSGTDMESLANANINEMAASSGLAESKASEGNEQIGGTESTNPSNNTEALASEITNAAEKSIETANEGKVGSSNISLPGYENVDVSNLTDKTEEELNALLAKILNNITILNARIAEIDADNTRLEGLITELENNNASIESGKGTISSQITAKQLEVNEYQETVKTEEAKLETFTNEFLLIQEELDEANAAIIQEQGRAEEEYKEEIEITTEKAINQYDPKSDEPFEKFFLRKLATAGLVVFSNIDSLNDKALNISAQAKKVLGNIQAQAEVVYYARARFSTANSELQGLKDKLTAQDDLINRNNTLISQYRAQITTNNTEKSTLNSAIAENNTKRTTIENAIKVSKYNAADVLSRISEAEKKLIKDNGIDITQGYFIAQAQDGNWHVYDSSGTSVARKYGKKGSGLQGSDIIPSGSGYVRNKKADSSSKAKEVFYLSEVNSDLTDGMQTSEMCSYTTCSPLSFDVNGDGVQTSSQVMMYDIDGDGQLDKINNSNDWVLAFDKDGNGIAGENGSELFGNNTDLDGDGVKDGFANGFDALKALAKQEGLIGDGDNILDEKDLSQLQQKFGLTMTRGYGGESRSFAELGITQINLAQTNDTTMTENFDGRHNNIMRQDGATFVVNGETREYADIWNAKFDTNDPKVTLNINENNVLAIKGEIDTETILDEAKRTAPHSVRLQQKIADYKAEQKAEEDKIAKEEEAKKEEEAAAEAKKKEEAENAKKVEAAKNQKKA